VKHLLLACSVFFIFTLSSIAQSIDASVCQILSSPESFDGKIVRVKGTVVAAFDEFAVRDASCGQPVNAVWLSYPEGTKGKAGPVAILQLQLAHNNTAMANTSARQPVKLDKNKDFKQFDGLLATPYKQGGMCLGCVPYTVTATLVGRLDGVQAAGVARDASGKFISASGFGNMNLYKARLVLQSVSDVAGQEIDYSKTSAAKGDSVREGGGGDPVAAAQQVAKAFGPDNPSGKLVESAAAAYGGPGEDNGVEVGFGTPNEAPSSEAPKGADNSPDGLLFNCKFDMDRLKGDALTRAITHIGRHIADLRGEQPPAVTPYELEYRGWQTTVLSAMASRQKTLTLPGGYLAWNADWAANDRSKMVDDAITAFLTGFATVGKH
jgi:hypothetical protein